MATFFGFCVLGFVLYLFHKKVGEEQDNSGDGYIIAAIRILITLLIEAIKSLVSSGIEKGREEGEAIGREKEREKLALRLIKKGTLSTQEISDLTGLSEEALQALSQ